MFDGNGQGSNFTIDFMLDILILATLRSSDDVIDECVASSFEVAHIQ